MKYEVKYINVDELSKSLNRAGRDGWRVVFMQNKPPGWTDMMYMVVFEK
jgi:hypothetical protein